MRFRCNTEGVIICESPNLIIRNFEPSDLGALVELFGDPEVMRYSTGTKTKDEVEKWMNRQPIEGPAMWAVVENSSGEVIGYAGVIYHSNFEGGPEYEVGFRLAKRFWGHGYGFEAATLVRDWVFAKYDPARVIAMVDPDNHHSIAVLTKMGGVHTSEYLAPEYDHADLVYSMNRPPRNW